MGYGFGADGGRKRMSMLSTFGRQNRADDGIVDISGDESEPISSAPVFDRGVSVGKKRRRSSTDDGQMLRR